MPMRRLSKQHKQALQNYVDNGGDKRKAAVDAGFSLSNSSRTMDQLLSRKPILESLEKRKVTDDYVALKIKQMLNAKHPLAPTQKDNHAIIKAIQEVNKISDNYPVQKFQSESKVISIHLTGDDFKAIKEVEEMRKEDD